MSGFREWQALLRELRDQGFIVTRTSQMHYCARGPDRSKPVVHFAESDDPRAIKNTLRDLRKAGFVWNKRNDAA